jgi:hypothetical protein
MQKQSDLCLPRPEAIPCVRGVKFLAIQPCDNIVSNLIFHSIKYNKQRFSYSLKNNSSILSSNSPLFLQNLQKYLLMLLPWPISIGFKFSSFHPTQIPLDYIKFLQAHFSNNLISFHILLACSIEFIQMTTFL